MKTKLCQLQQGLTLRQARSFPLDPWDAFHYTFSTGGAPAVIESAISDHNYSAQTKMPVPVC